MLKCFFSDQQKKIVTIYPLAKDTLTQWLSEQADFIQQWVRSTSYQAKPGQYCLVPTPEGELGSVLIGLADSNDWLQLGVLPSKLPQGHYQLDTTNFNEQQVFQLFLAWGLGYYKYQDYKKSDNKLNLPKLELSSSINQPELESLVASIWLARDLINRPAEDCTPHHLSETAHMLASKYGARCDDIVGDALLSKNYPAIHAVGRAAHNAPRLIDLRWGEENHKHVTLVCKGVCFDSGGLNIKPGRGMRDMKKDMGGSALGLALSRLIMEANLPVRLRLLIAAVENSVSGNSYRPGDVIRMRNGLSVEISNTDAEGRLVIGDALAAAASDKPDCLIDFTTLTGAARVALGPDLPVLFSNSKSLAESLLASGQAVSDPLWQLPLYQGYRRYLHSPIADTLNAAEGGFAGAITAALFLQQFVDDSIPWAHFDCYCWNKESLPGRPVGGEALALRAVFHYIKQLVSD